MLTELNPITASQLNQMNKNIANEVDRSLERWMDYADYLDTLTSQDLTTLGYGAESIAYIGSFRLALLNMFAFGKSSIPFKLINGQIN